MHSIVTTFREAVIKVEVANFGAAIDTLIDQDGPQQADDWITRSRLWPLKDEIERIVCDGCQVVPRSSPGGDNTSEWRLSFSITEIRLAKLRSLDQQWAYYLFKGIFYCYLKSIEPSDAEEKPLFSYIIKTTMLYVCEEHPPTDPVWSSLEASVVMLLKRLVEGLRKGIVPHYFLPEINLLDRVGSDVIELSIGVIMSLENHPYEALPDDFDEKLDLLRLIRSFCEKGKAIASLFLEKKCTFYNILPQLAAMFEEKKWRKRLLTCANIST